MCALITWLILDEPISGAMSYEEEILDKLEEELNDLDEST